jgi:hypothetical protein
MPMPVMQAHIVSLLLVYSVLCLVFWFYCCTNVYKPIIYCSLIAHGPHTAITSAINLAFPFLRHH